MTEFARDWAFFIHAVHLTWLTSSAGVTTKLTVLQRCYSLGGIVLVIGG